MRDVEWAVLSHNLSLCACGLWERMPKCLLNKDLHHQELVWVSNNNSIYPVAREVRLQKHDSLWIWQNMVSKTRQTSQTRFF